LDPKEYELMFQVERKHWWYLGMQSITEALLNQYYGTTRKLSILDAGCGTGAAMTACLNKYGGVTGIDLSSIALKFSRDRNAERLAHASVTQLPFATGRFDLITSFDVLYERGVPSDLKAIREFFRVLVPGGRVLLRLPAYDWLRGRHDHVIHTARRYTTVRLRSLLEMAGFQVERLTYANTILFPLALAKRLFDNLSTKAVPVSDLSLPTGPLNHILQRILAFESGVITRFNLPYGLSVIAIASKSK
jgi:SAM-dependent methyltransferase